MKTPKHTKHNQDTRNELQDKGRRHFVMGTSAMLALAAVPFSSRTHANSISQPLPQLSGNVFDLSIDYKTVNYTGKRARATVVNQSLPAPILRWKEGETV